MSVSRFDPFGDPLRTLDRLASQMWSGGRTPMGMAMDVWEADDGYHVALDLPGVDPGSVDITCERNMLTIKAERKAEYEQAKIVLVAERPQGTFTRQLQLGETLDTSKVQASYHDGVLHLTIPMAEQAQPRKIEVRSGGGGTTQVTQGDGSEKSGS